MAKPRKTKAQLFHDIWQTDYEKFFHNGEWDHLLNTVAIPLECLTHPPADGDTSGHSWDRKAAYLLWSALHDEEARERIAAAYSQGAGEGVRRLLVQSTWGPFSAGGDW